MKKVLSLFRTFEGQDDAFFYSYLNQLCAENKIEFVNFDDTSFVHFNAVSIKSRSLRFLMRKEQVELFNQTIKKYIALFKPDIFIFFKAHSLQASTIELAKKNGAKIFAIYPDLEPKVHGQDYLKVLQLSDLLIHTKPNLAQYFKTLNSNTICVAPFISNRFLKNIENYEHKIGVSFIGHHSPEKQKSIQKVAETINENVTIYGENWNQRAFNNNNKIIAKGAVFGPPVYKVYQQSLFVLGLLTEKLIGFQQGDVLTARSVQIPAYGGLIAHPRNKFSEDFFGKDHFMLYRNWIELASIYNTLKNDIEYRNSLFKTQQQIVLQKATIIETLLNAILYDEKSNFNMFNIL